MGTDLISLVVTNHRFCIDRIHLSAAVLSNRIKVRIGCLTPLGWMGCYAALCHRFYVLKAIDPILGLHSILIFPLSISKSFFLFFLFSLVSF